MGHTKEENLKNMFDFKNVFEECVLLEITNWKKRRGIELYRLTLIHFRVCDCLVPHSRLRPRITNSKNCRISSSSWF